MHRGKTKNNRSGTHSSVASPSNLTRLDDELKLAAGIRYRLGEMLLQAGRITHYKLESAIAEQRKNGEKLGRVLIKMGLDLGELDVALEFQHRQATKEPTFGLLRFGELMIATGLITREQMAASLLRQKLTGKKLGEDLVAEGLVRPQQIAHTLQFQQKLVSAALATALTLGSFTASAAGRASNSRLAAPTVAAATAKQATLKVLAQPDHISISAEDINRGYVDTSSPLTAEIKNSSLSGYMLVFENDEDFVHHIYVKGLGNDFRLDAKGGVITQPFAAPLDFESTLTIGFRFMLADHARPGTYDWPLRISAMPL